jgi:hypothetical protein
LKKITPGRGRLLANLIQWTNGDAVAGDNTQRTVDRGTSAMTAVQAVIGVAPAQEVDIWILWATITNQITGTTPPNAVQFGTRYDGTENLGAIAYNGGMIAVGKIVPIGLITPAGVHNVVNAGWTFGRDRWSHDFVDGAKSSVYFENAWTEDVISFQVLTPDENDQIYDRDAPNVLQGENAKDSYETYNNFREYIQWNGTAASDYQGWYWKGWWKQDQNPQITLKEIGQGAITLPDTSHYPAP